MFCSVSLLSPRMVESRAAAVRSPCCELSSSHPHLSTKESERGSHRANSDTAAGAQQESGTPGGGVTQQGEPWASFPSKCLDLGARTCVLVGTGLSSRSLLIPDK